MSSFRVEVTRGPVTIHGSACLQDQRNPKKASGSYSTLIRIAELGYMKGPN